MGTLKGSKPNYSLLSDHLYALKARAEQDQKTNAGKKLLLADLVTNTPLLAQIRDTLPAEGSRAKNIAASLSVFQQSSLARPKNLVRRKVDKGKARADVRDDYGHGAFRGIHVHRMSLVSQIQDLFPELGAGFVVKLLDEYDNDAEQVTAHLLDDSLPAYLAEADRTEQLYVLLTLIIHLWHLALCVHRYAHYASSGPKGVC
jgi:activating signal cointegrator complex subunit 2